MLIIIIAQWDVGHGLRVQVCHSKVSHCGDQRNDNKIGHFQEQTIINQPVCWEQAKGG
jgi:hypothetical protein